MTGAAVAAGVSAASDGLVRAVIVRRVGFVDPADLLGAAGADRGPVALFDSARVTGGHRWSYLAADALGVATGSGDAAFAGLVAAVRGVGAAGAQVVRDVAAAGGIVPPFCGGLVGRLGYELAAGIEAIPYRPPAAGDPADDWALFEPGVVVAADRATGRAWVCGIGCGGSAAAAHADAVARLQRGWVPHTAPTPEVPCAAVASAAGDAAARRGVVPAGDALAAVGFTPDGTRDAYLEAIATIQDGIVRGDVYEVCLAQRFAYAGPAADALRVPAAAVYSAVRAASPAPMAAFVRIGDTELFSTSPERFVRVGADGWMATEPIKGTRPRAADAATDAAAAAELVASAKDGAEHLMIVDLARNDLGRVAAYGTVRVPSLARLERHAHTHQLVSTVRGRLAPGQTTADLLAAAFPPGSMTGAPKVAAMQAIARLETRRRGPFAGALGWFGYDGAADLAVVIRTLIRTPQGASLHVGGAIVADSDPAAEYQETLDKAVGVASGLADVQAACE